MFRVLRNRRAFLYLSGFTLSSAGSSILFLAVGIWVKSLTGSSAAAGATVFFIMAPSLFAPLLGVLIDRMERTVVATSAVFAMGGLFEAVVFDVVANLKRDPAFLGVLVSVQGAGAIGLLAAALSLGLLLIPSSAAALLAMLMLGAGIAAAMIALNTLVQRRTPADLLGRVGSGRVGCADQSFCPADGAHCSRRCPGDRHRSQGLAWSPWSS
ncbi:hypothetical protein [Arthrobacter sp. D1-17]